jgi:hypothetical protein
VTALADLVAFAKRADQVRRQRFRHTRLQRAGQIARLRSLADEIAEPLVCRDPAYGAPGHAHCAACCYGTLRVITCAEDEAIWAAVDAMQTAARILGGQPL